MHGPQQAVHTYATRAQTHTYHTGTCARKKHLRAPVAKQPQIYLRKRAEPHAIWPKVSAIAHETRQRAVSSAAAAEAMPSSPLRLRARSLVRTCRLTPSFIEPLTHRPLLHTCRTCIIPSRHHPVPSLLSPKPAPKPAPPLRRGFPLRFANPQIPRYRLFLVTAARSSSRPAATINCPCTAATAGGSPVTAHCQPGMNCLLQLPIHSSYAFFNKCQCAKLRTRPSPCRMPLDGPPASEAACSAQNTLCMVECIPHKTSSLSPCNPQRALSTCD